MFCSFKKNTSETLVVALKKHKTLYHFFKALPLFSRLFPSLENGWVNFKTFSRNIQDSVRTLSVSYNAIKCIIAALATTSCKSTWDTVPYFDINSLSMILCLWSPHHPLSKLLAIQDHTQNLEQQLWMGGRREVSVIPHRPVTRSDLKQERSVFLWECLNIFAAGCSINEKINFSI